MLRSPGLFLQPIIPYRGAGITIRYHNYHSNSFSQRVTIKPSFFTRPTHTVLNPNIWVPIQCGRTDMHIQFPDTKFYPLCAGSICLGRVNPEEISLCMRTGLCIHKHLIRYSQTHDVCEHTIKIMRLRPTFCLYTIWYAPPWGQWVYKDLVKFPPICIDTQWLACARPRLNNINPYYPLLFTTLLLRRYTDIPLPVPDSS